MHNLVGKITIEDIRRVILLSELIALQSHKTSSGLAAHPWLLVECRTLEGEPERSAFEYKKQLHSHDCHQNVTGQ